jgi:5-methylcytosine-specific restriction endonuclease McrA
MKRNPVKTLKKKADKLLQEKFVKDNPYCLVCGKPTLCGHHFIHKSQSNFLRYDFDNLIPVCFSCHCKIHQSQDPEPTDKIIRVKGQEWADNLYKRRRNIFKMNHGNLKEVIGKLNML